MVRAFTTTVLLINLALLAVGYWPFTALWGTPFYTALSLGALYSVVLFLASFSVAHRNFEANFNRFMGVVFGGMGARLLLVCAALITVFVMEFLNEIGFTVGVLISYICNSVAEVIYINRLTK